MLISNLRQTNAYIDLSALQHNYNLAKELAPNSKVVAVIKSNGYGHGMLEIAKKLAFDADAFAVSSVDEAIYLNEHDFNTVIIILQGFNDEAELSSLIKLQVQSDIIPTIHNFHQLELLINFSQQNLIKRPLKAWVKFDTGMHRLGFQIEDLERLESYFEQLNKILEPVALSSHFACADNPDSPLNTHQMQEFEQIHLRLNNALSHKMPASLANSAAIFSQKDAHLDWVRPGIMLYGVNPFEPATKINHLPELNSLKAVMHFESKIIAIKRVKKGETIGYGANYYCEEDKLIGIVAVGYGDGYPRHAQTGTPMMVNGIKTQLLGRVSMDMICVDLSDVQYKKQEVKIGDKVTLWGKDILVEQVASYSQTIAYELLCGITSRVNFFYR